jgi:hypothetical protein
MGAISLRYSEGKHISSLYYGFRRVMQEQFATA